MNVRLLSFTNNSSTTISSLFNKALILALCGVVSIPQVFAETPPRFVSINLCTDQLLLSIADSTQIISLSYLATDKVSSALATEAATFPFNRGTTEEVLALNPDIVLAGAYTTQPTVSLLKKLGMRVEVFEPANSIEQIEANVRRMAALTGHEAKGVEIITQMQQHLNDVNQSTNETLIFADYGVNGWTSGDGTLTASLANAAGYKTLAQQMDAYGGRYITLEDLLLSPPDLLDVDNSFQSPPSRSTQALNHPALRRLQEQVATVSIPAALLACGTPKSLHALDMFAAARKPGEE